MHEREQRRRAELKPKYPGATAAWHMLSHGTVYDDLATNYFVQRDKHKHARKLVKRLEDLGYKVALHQAA